MNLNDRPLRLWVHETLYLNYISRTYSFSGNISPDRYREKALVVVLFPDGRQTGNYPETGLEEINDDDHGFPQNLKVKEPTRKSLTEDARRL